jgi:membrane protein DedA with SNARE-associated domain
MLKMKYTQFLVWNFIDGAVYVLAVGPASYAAGKIVAGEQDWASLGLLLAGLAVAAGFVVLAIRYVRYRKVHRLPDSVDAGEAG